MQIITQKLKNHHYQNIILLIFFAIIICLRAPDVFLYGRFWAEEGSIFFYNAWNMPPLQALFNSFGGYLNLPTNAVTLIARWCIPLEYAPYFTTFIGLLFQLLPLYLLLTAKDKWLSNFQIRLFLTLLLLFVPETTETNLQSLHIQFQLTLAAATILILQPDYSYKRWLRISILLLAGLSGLMNIVLLPIYAIRCWINKNKLNIQEFFSLLASCLIQYFFFYEKVSGRFHSLIITDFSNIFFVHELFIPLLGLNRYSVHYIDYLHNNIQNISASLIPAIFVLLFGLGILWIFYKNIKTRQASFLFFSALFLFNISILGSLGNRSDFLIPFTNQRYLFISQSLFCIMLVYITYHLSANSKKICQIIICWLIFIGAIHYFSDSTLMTKAPANCLPWKQQVQLWKKDPNYIFQIWPSWEKMSLPVHIKQYSEEK